MNSRTALALYIPWNHRQLLVRNSRALALGSYDAKCRDIGLVEAIKGALVYHCFLHNVAPLQHIPVEKPHSFDGCNLIKNSL